MFVKSAIASLMAVAFCSTAATANSDLEEFVKNFPTDEAGIESLFAAAINKEVADSLKNPQFLASLSAAYPTQSEMQQFIKGIPTDPAGVDSMLKSYNDEHASRMKDPAYAKSVSAAIKSAVDKLPNGATSTKPLAVAAAAVAAAAIAFF
ncbi:hypothetical protein FBU59_006498 [Linderina macrospora]|uniref:Uncharacterized protein n=1 Tax=Linderina macrospora TaxID=4868 RepID=A0ACC1IZQ7_9FUNG|nr:hypothetical protein FBU59_006498 [Linderina macrospora]